MALDYFRLMGNSGLRVSPLCLGTMTFGTEWGWGADKNESRAVFDGYVDAGGNFIDTANVYTGGTSEKLVGEFSKGRREQLVIATKYTCSMRDGDANASGNHRKNLVQSVEASLKRLGMDYVDMLVVHAWDQVTPAEEIMRALDDLVRSGKVLYLGVSNVTAWESAHANTMAEMRGWTSFINLQVHYSLIERGVERELVPMSQKLGLGLTAWSPLGGGLLTGKYARLDQGSSSELDASLRKETNAGRLTEHNLIIVDELGAVSSEIGKSSAQVAIRWVLQRSGVSSVIVGARTRAQLDDNLGAMSFELSGEHMDRLDKVSRIELGYPHDFLRSGSIKRLLSGGTRIEGE